MLYLLHMGNRPELSYRGGQGPILHLEADLEATACWADAAGARCAFSLSDAGGVYAEFRSSLAQLRDVDWAAVANSDFSSASVKEGKQAEFLVQRFFPWHLVERVGVHSALSTGGGGQFSPGADTIRALPVVNLHTERCTAVAPAHHAARDRQDDLSL